MSGIENLNARLAYYGGDAEHRFWNDKLHGLRKALLYAYQDATIVLFDEDGAISEKSDRFRGLINPDKNSGDYDNKILSIPYEDINLKLPITGKKTSLGKQQIDIHPGTVFYWEETSSYWLVYLEYIEEKAYFRAGIRRCDQQTEINDKKYWTYIRGPKETSIPWNQKAGVEWNDMNYSLVMYITKDENTIDYFHRFVKVKIEDEQSGTQKTWQVVGVNPYYGDGIVEVYLDEYFENTIEEAHDKEVAEAAPPIVIPGPDDVYIDGPATVTAYDEITYTIVNAEDGAWSVIMDDKEYFLSSDSDKENTSAWVNIQKTKKLLVEQISASIIKIYINVSEGNFTIFYKTDDEDISLEVSIENRIRS